MSQRSALTDGTQITYWLPQTSGSGATLNLTLKDGNTTGAIPLYSGGTTRLSTHYPAGSVLHLTYRENVTIGTISFPPQEVTVFLDREHMSSIGFPHASTQRMKKRTE